MDITREQYLISAKEAGSMTVADLLQEIIWCRTEDIYQWTTPHRSNRQHKGRYKSQILAISELLRRGGESKTLEDIQSLLRDNLWPENEVDK